MVQRLRLNGTLGTVLLKSTLPSSSRVSIVTSMSCSSEERKRKLLDLEMAPTSVDVVTVLLKPVSTVEKPVKGLNALPPAAKVMRTLFAPAVERKWDERSFLHVAQSFGTDASYGVIRGGCSESVVRKNRLRQSGCFSCSI